MDLWIEISFSYFLPQTNPRLFSISWLTQGFLRILLIVSSRVWNYIIIVTTLLSIHCYIWKFILLLIQWIVLNRLSEMLLVSFGGNYLIALAVPKTATLSSLSAINIWYKVKISSIPTTYFFVFLLGSDSMRIILISMTFFPSSFVFPTIAAGSNF